MPIYTLIIGIADIRKRLVSQKQPAHTHNKRNLFHDLPFSRHLTKCFTPLHQLQRSKYLKNHDFCSTNVLPHSIQTEDRDLNTFGHFITIYS